MLIEQPGARHANEIFGIFLACRQKMEQEEIFQWTENYPVIEIVHEDIANGSLYGVVHEGNYLAVVSVNEEQAEAYKNINWADTVGKVMVIHRLAVQPEWQKQGLAKILMDFAEDHAANHAFSSIRLDAYSGNPRALKFYESREYAKRGEVYFPGRVLPFYCYEKKLS